MPARLQVAVGEIEAGRLDDVDGEAEAGGHAQDRAGVAGDVGLVERDADAVVQYLALLIVAVAATVALAVTESCLAGMAICRRMGL